MDLDRDRTVRAEVCDISQKMYNEKLIAGTSGNVSALVTDTVMAITPSSYDYGIMTADDIVLMELDGTVLQGKHAPSSEWQLHAALYRELPHVRAVVHTHSPFATSFAVVHKEIPVILIEMLPFLKGSIPVSPYAPAGTPEVGLNTAPMLRERNACLLANHGAVAVGDTLESAYINAVYAEDAAKIYHMACCVGTPVTIQA